MSGGTAYFLDLDTSLLNTEMVDALELSPADQDQLKQLVNRHFEETESAVAERLLADWGSSVGRFTKVLPRDYARVLAARDQAERDGLDEASDDHSHDGGGQWMSARIGSLAADRSGMLPTAPRPGRGRNASLARADHGRAWRAPLSLAKTGGRSRTQRCSEQSIARLCRLLSRPEG